MSKITVELTKSVKFTPDNTGEQADGKFITLREPTAKPKELKICSFFKQEFFKAAAAASKDNKTDDIESHKEESETTGSQIIYMMYSSVNTDMPKVMEKAKELFKLLGKIEDKRQLTDPILDSLSQDDIENLLGEFLVNFTLRSALSSQ